MNFVDSLKIGGVDAFQLPCIKIKGAPTTETAGAVGLFCIDTATGNLYKCIAAADGVYTWEVFGGAVKTVNGAAPDENGNVEIETGGTGGGSVAVDNTLSVEGKAADAKAVGDAFAFETKNSKNLLNLETVTVNQNFNSSGGIITSSSYSMSDYIPVTSGQVLSFQFLHKGNAVIGNMRWLVAYDVDGNILDMQADIATYTIPENAVAIRITASNDRISKEYNPMIIEGTSVIEYEEYYVGQKTDISGIKVRKENVIGLDLDAELLPLENAIKKNTYNFRKVDVVCDTYSNDADKITFDNHDTVNVIYDMYDALVAAYPDYVTKTLLGTIETDSLPIYRYDFTPKLPLNSKMERLCKMVYCSGTHGGENTPILVGVRFFKDLCENWRNQDLLRTLRFNCQFTVIPIVNPYGFVHATRQNENQVDLNRNFTNGWHNANNLVVGDTNYPGASPASEISTQLIEAMLASEPFDFGIDHHTYGAYTASGKSGYFVTSSSRPEDVSLTNLLGVWMNGKTMSDNTLINDFSTSHFQTIIGTSPGGYLYGAFPNGFCFENMHIWGSDEMEAVYDSQKFNAETIGAIFHSAFVGYHTY